jgi:hypothetical protein
LRVCITVYIRLRERERASKMRQLNSVLFFLLNHSAARQILPQFSLDLLLFSEFFLDPYPAANRNLPEAIMDDPTTGMG